MTAVWRKVNSAEHKYAPVKTQGYQDEVTHHGKLTHAGVNKRKERTRHKATHKRSNTH